MICHNHRLKNPEWNEDPCVFCERDAALLQVRELCGPYSSVDLAKKRFETMAAELKEKDRLNGAMKAILQELRKNYILNAWTRQDINERLIAAIRDVLFDDPTNPERPNRETWMVTKACNEHKHLGTNYEMRPFWGPPCSPCPGCKYEKVVASQTAGPETFTEKRVDPVQKCGQCGGDFKLYPVGLLCPKCSNIPEERKCEVLLHNDVMENCVHKCGHDLPCPFHK